MIPSLYSLPQSLAITAAIGAVYGLIFKVNVKVAAIAFAVSALVDTIFFLIANPLFGGDAHTKSLKIFMVTHGLVSIASIVAFRKLGLIANLGTAILAALEVAGLIQRITVIVTLEAQAAYA